jgi:hypothetical protein
LWTEKAESAEMVDSTLLDGHTTMVAETPNIVGVAAKNFNLVTAVKSKWIG